MSARNRLWGAVAIATAGALGACQVPHLMLTPARAARGPSASGSRPGVQSRFAPLQPAAFEGGTGSRFAVAVDPRIEGSGLAAPYRIQFAGSDVAQIVAGIFDRTAPATTGFVESLGYFNDNGGGLSTTDPLTSTAFTNLGTAMGTAGGPTIPSSTNRADSRRWLFYRVTGASPHTVTLKDFPLPSAEHQYTLFAAALDSYDAVIGLAQEDLTCCTSPDVITNTGGSNTANLTVNLNYAAGLANNLGSFQVANEFVGNGYSDLLLGAFDTTTTPHFGFVGAGTALGSPTWLAALESAMSAQGYTDTANTRRYLIKDVSTPTAYTVYDATFSEVPNIASGSLFAVPIKGGSSTGLGQYAASAMASSSTLTVLANDVSLSDSALAGDGTGGYSSDGVAATTAEVDNPDQLAVDTSGNVYFADYTNQRVRMVCAASGTYFGQSMTAGDIYTIAGTGTLGSTLLTGTATSVALNDPRSVAVSGGNVFVSEAGFNAVQEIQSTGNLVTFAGNGTAGHLGDGGSATSAELDNPDGVAVDASGNVYIADYANDVIRMVCATSGTYFGQTMTAGDIYRIAGTYLSAGFSGDGGSATSAQLNLPQGLAVDSGGTVYIADTSNNCIRQIAATGIISTLAGSVTAGSVDGTGTAAQFKSPRDVCTASGRLYVADSSNFGVREIDLSSAKVITIAGTGASGMGTVPGFSPKVALDEPYGLAVTPSGGVAMSDYLNNRVLTIQ